MKVYGLTGGIGSGKSTIARIFNILGVPIYQADDRAKWLMQHDLQIQQGIQDIFGKEIIDSAKGLDFQMIGKQAFVVPAKLEQLNRIVHPAVATDFITWTQSRKEDLLLKEAAIIFETGMDKLLDGVIVVSAPEDLRIRRVMHRNGLSEEAVRLRMAQQWPEEKLCALANFIILNDESSLVTLQVLDILKQLRGSGNV